MKVVIVGAGGQDGTLLQESLRRQGSSVIGIERSGIWFEQRESVQPFALGQSEDWQRLLTEHKVHAVYYLAAYHHSAAQRDLVQAGELWEKSLAVNYEGWMKLLQAVQAVSPTTRLFYAASSLVFGQPGHSPQDENTPLCPTTPYGLSKQMGIEAARYFRRQGIYAATGILYNHESRLRKPEFVSMCIVQGLIAVARGQARELVLRDLEAVVDWGDAEDYVEAMQLILQQPESHDFIIATGQAHWVGDFARIVCERLGLDYALVVKQAPASVPKKIAGLPLVGQPKLLAELTGWKPRYTFAQMVGKMIEAELARG